MNSSNEKEVTDTTPPVEVATEKEIRCECSDCAVRNAKFSALFLGMPVIEYIADQLMEKGKASFEEDGRLTRETEREVWVLLTQALQHPALRAMFVSSLCRDAIKEAAGHRWLEM